MCVCVFFFLFYLRILVWADGYYNGAIKTRKTVQPMEVSAEEASLQRSQQLKELYETLSAGETNQQQITNRRPTAALSPEDLTESEWFYLMCVSFSFPPGIGYVLKDRYCFTIFIFFIFFFWEEKSLNNYGKHCVYEFIKSYLIKGIKMERSPTVVGQLKLKRKLQLSRRRW